jgi:hypothetical protein
MADERDVTSCELTASLPLRNWAPPIAGVMVAATGACAMLFAPAPSHPYAIPSPAEPIGLLAVVLGLPFAVLTFVLGAFPRNGHVTLRASGSQLEIEGLAPIRVDDIAEVKSVPQRSAEHAVVALILRVGATRLLRMRSSDAATLVRVLGVGAGARRSVFSVMTPYGKRFIAAFTLLGAFVGMFLLCGFFGPVSAPFSAVLAVLALLMMFVLPVSMLFASVAGLHTGRLVIAADGFSLRWLVRERFVPFTDVTDVRRALTMMDGGIPRSVVCLRDRREIVLRAGDIFVARKEFAAQGEALYEHLRAAFSAAKQRRGGGQPIAPLLASGDRGGAEWLAHLDALVHGGATRYRVAAPEAEILADVACDASTPADVRIGAAAALARLSESGRRTVRVAADGCARPALREALIALSNASSDDRFAEILERARKSAS